MGESGVFLGMLGLLVGFLVGWDVGQKVLRFTQDATSAMNRLVVSVHGASDTAAEAPNVGMMLAMGRLTAWGLWRVLRNATMALHRTADSLTRM